MESNKERRPVQGDQNSFQCFLNQEIEGVFFYTRNLNGRFEYASPGVESILGVSSREFRDKGWEFYFGKQENPQSAKFSSQVDESLSVKPWEVKTHHKDGREVWLEAIETPVFNSANRVCGFEALARDITEKKQTREELNQAVGELNRIARDQEEFARIAAQSLKEPLRKISVFSGKLKHQISGRLENKGRDFFGRMERSSSKMESLIDDLLQYSRMSAQGGPFKKVDLNKLISEVLLDLDEGIKYSQGVVAVEELPVVYGDAFQLRQIFQHLILNSLKFQMPDKAPRVQIFSRRPEDGAWEICVHDNGVGFDGKYLERILKPFERLHGNDQFHGNGLGLALCKKIADNHGATLTAQSVPNEGSCFILRFPENLLAG